MTSTMHGADIVELRELGGLFDGAEKSLKDIEARLTLLVMESQSWTGKDADRFRAEWSSHLRGTVLRAASISAEAKQSILQHAQEQESASSADQPQGTPHNGMSANSALWWKQPASLASGPTPSPSPLPEPVPPSDEDVAKSRDRAPDGRDGRRIDRDERERREEGTAGTGHFDSDWAGRSILDRYMSGGGDWQIKNDPAWTRYMESSPTLADNLRDPVTNQASSALEAYLTSGRSSGSIDENMSMTMENGEGIVGHQYLHGTNTEVGGFDLTFWLRE